jgi:hypothetical protein
MTWILKYYQCSRCGTEWTDAWSCACNDRCPRCRAEIEPYDDEDLTYMIEPGPDGTFVVMFSPEEAEDSPDYVSIGVFTSRQDAMAHIEAIQLSREA